MSALGAAPSADKSAYSLANPTPDSLLREMSTDRPDTTEGPATVDAGRVQIEMDFAGFTRNRLDGVRTTEWGLAPFNIRLGLRQDFEVGVFVAPYVRQTETPRGGPREKHAGFGDLTLRAKFNFWGNDGGESAGGLILDLKLPTARRALGNGAVEGAVSLPLAFELPAGWELGLMTKADLRHRDGGGMRAVWVNTATVGHDLWSKNFGGYLELTSQAGEGAHVATFNFGVTWKVNPNLQFDCGAELGVTRTADDARFFAGVSRRF
ncbi:MAG: transporter [Opitutaceae bacterium]